MKEHKAAERKISIVPILAETLLGWVFAFVFGFFHFPVYNNYVKYFYLNFQDNYVKFLTRQ